MPVELCTETILELQRNSLENLKQKNQYQESGLATLKIKVLLQGAPPKILTKQIKLSLNASEMRTIIITEMNISSDRYTISPRLTITLTIPLFVD